MPKFIDYTGKMVPGRRPRQTHTDADGDDQALLLKQLTQRLAELEAIVPLPAVEFEVTLPASGTVKFNHGFGCPVRVYPVWWEDTSTTTTTVNQSTDITAVSLDAIPAITYKFNYDFSTLTLGKYTAGNFLSTTATGNTQGLTFTRATVSTVQTSPTSLDVTPGVDEACIGSMLGTAANTGLVIQSRVKQFFGNGGANSDSVRNLTRTGANMWAAGLHVTTSYPNGTDSPDGTGSGVSVTTVSHVGTPGVDAVYGYSNFALLSAGAAFTTTSFWTFIYTPPTPSGTGFMNTGVLNGTTKSGSVPAALGGNVENTWNRYQIKKGSYLAAAFAIYDARDQQGMPFLGADGGARCDYFQYEHGNFANEVIATAGGDRAHDRLSYPTGSQLISTTGQFKMYCKMIPKGSSADQVNITSAATVVYSAGRYLFSVGAVSATANDYAYIRDSDKKLVVKLAGGIEVVSLNGIAWSEWDTVEIYMAVGSGLPSVAMYKINGSGVWRDLVLGVVRDVPAFGSTAVHFFVNSTIVHASGNNDIGSFPCWLQKLQIFDAGSPSGTELLSYTSGTIPVATSSTRPHSPDFTVNRAQSTPDTVVLNSYNAIKTVIRVESAQAAISPPLLGI